MTLAVSSDEAGRVWEKSGCAEGVWFVRFGGVWCCGEVSAKGAAAVVGAATAAAAAAATGTAAGRAAVSTLGASRAILRAAGRIARCVA